MKKAFTLIELLVTLTLGIIFFQFVLEFKLNFYKELTDLKKENQLVKEMYHLSQMTTKGFSYEGEHIPGMNTIKTLWERDKFRSYYNNRIVDYDDNNNNFSIELRRGGRYINFELKEFHYNKYLLPTRLTIENIKPYDKEEHADDIYHSVLSIQDKNNENIIYENYVKLVYTK